MFKGCISEGPGQAGGMGQQEHHEIRQEQLPSSMPGKTKHLGTRQAGDACPRSSSVEKALGAFVGQ